MLTGEHKNKIHETDHPLEISVTSEEFDDETSSNDKTIISVNDLRLQCHNCPRKFHKKIHLLKHLNIHDESRPLKCEFCDKRFNLMWHLRRHQLIHNRVKPFSCTHCDKSFCTKCELSRHINYTHFGIKEYICDVCKRSFTLKSNLKVHQRKHTGEKPYKCNICDQTFYQSGHLTYHLKKHTGSSPDTVDTKVAKFTTINKFNSMIRSGHRPNVITEKSNRAKPLSKGKDFSYDRNSKMMTPKIYSYYKCKTAQTNTCAPSRVFEETNPAVLNQEYLYRIRNYYMNHHYSYDYRYVKNTNNEPTIWRPFNAD